MGLFKRNTITSNVINNLKYDKKSELYEGKSYINKFNTECDVTIEGATIEYAEKCINYLNNEMSEELFDNILEYLCKYCNYYVENYQDDVIPFKIYGKEILDYISDIAIHIYKPETDTIGFVIAGNCAWEIESGFAIVINDNKVKYVGEYGNLYNPWDEYKEVCDYD